MKSTGTQLVIHPSNASSLQKTAQALWTLKISLNILRNQREAEDGEIPKNTEGPVPVGDTDSLVPVRIVVIPEVVGSTGILVTWDVIEGRIKKCMGGDGEKTMEGSSEDTVGRSDA